MTAGARGLVEWLRLRYQALNIPTLPSRGIGGPRMTPFPEASQPAAGRSPTSYKLPNDPEVYDGEALGMDLYTRGGGAAHVERLTGARVLEEDYLSEYVRYEVELE